MKNLKKGKYVFIFLLLLTILGGFLRFYKNTQNPISLSIDEVLFGYNAYSILKTGRDEYGKFLPLSFKSTGDYKNPVPIYSMVPSIALFGLNEFSIRLPTLILATLSIPVFFLFFIEITSSMAISLIATSLLTISPWHIYYSRYVSDHLIAMFLVILGDICFLRMIRKGRWFWSVASSIFLIFSTFFGPDRARAQMTWVGNDVEFVRNVAVKPLQNIPAIGSENFLLFYFVARKYLNYFDPAFLFYSGLNLTKEDSYGLGVLYLFELPFLIAGIIMLFKKNIRNKKLIITWLLIGLIPASLTNNEQHPGRTFFILPMILLISAIGAMEFYKFINNYFSRRLKKIIYIIFVSLVVFNLTQALLIYTVHFPHQRGEDFMEGTKETVLYSLANKHKYKEIVFDPYRGIEAPYIVSIPHMYILFYANYDPKIY